MTTNGDNLIELLAGSYTTKCEETFEKTTNKFIRIHLRRKLSKTINNLGIVSNIEYNDGMRSVDFINWHLHLKNPCAECAKEHYFVRFWNIKEIEEGIVKYDYTVYIDNRQCHNHFDRLKKQYIKLYKESKRLKQENEEIKLENEEIKREFDKLVEERRSAI